MNLASVAFLSHSLMAQNGIQCRMPPSLLRDTLPDVAIWNLARDANTAWRTMNITDWNGQGTILDHVVALQPTHLIWCLEIAETGINTPPVATKLNVDNRTPDELWQDAQELCTALRSKCQGTKLIYMQAFSGAYQTPEYAALAGKVRADLAWDGVFDLDYENCVGAAQDCKDAGLVDFAHPTRLTAVFQQAQISSALGAWFDVPNMLLPQWNNVAAFRAALKANDAYALAAVKSLTT